MMLPVEQTMCLSLRWKREGNMNVRWLVSFEGKIGKNNEKKIESIAMFDGSFKCQHKTAVGAGNYQ
jgi:hypothetical protein